MKKIGCLLLITLLLNSRLVLCADYNELRSNALGKCELIDSSDYQSSLMLNPDGYRSYYVRSACFQNAAIKFRDETTCSQVKRRFALFSSSWGYSKSNCEKLVKEGIDADRNQLLKIKNDYVKKGPVQLIDFQVERNGNGRDFDIIPSFEDGYVHSYTLKFNIINVDSGEGTVLLDSSGFHLTGLKNNIRLFVRQVEIKNRFPNFATNQSYTVRGTVLLSVGNGTQAGKWSDAFIKNIFPEKDRTQTIEKEILF